MTGAGPPDDLRQVISLVADPALRAHLERRAVGRRAVVAVFLPREHLPFVRDWCEHHLADGWEVVLYDNTGSTGSGRATCAYQDGRLQAAGIDARGNRYGAHTADLDDDEVGEALVRELDGLPVTIVPWRPLDADGRQIYGQVEAYVDYIERARREVAWAAFIDVDEYLDRSPTRSWDELLLACQLAGCHRVVIDALRYESRWTPDGAPRRMQDLRILGAQEGGSKNIVRLGEVVRADVHWRWEVRGGLRFSRPDRSLYALRHHASPTAELDLAIEERVLGRTADESHAVSQEAGPARRAPESW